MAPGSRPRAGGRKLEAEAPGSRLPASGSPKPAGPELQFERGSAGSPAFDDMVTVGRVARPHGIRGQVFINPDTDFVEERFTVGSSFVVRAPEGEETLIVTSSRVQGGRPVVGFEGFERIEDVERLAGLELRVPEETLQPLDAGSFYHHQLIGCVVTLTDGTVVGEVERVEGGIGGSRLAVKAPAGEILVPLARAICVEIDVAAKRIRIDPPEGLLDLNETKDAGGGRAGARGRSRAPGGARVRGGRL